MNETAAPAWTMDYSGPETLLATKYGEVKVTFTGAGHAHVSAYSDGSRPGDIEYRGKHWYASVHVYAEHGWGENPDRKEYRHQFSSMDAYGKPIAPTYRAAIVAAMTEAVSAYVTANPGVLTAAGRNHLQHDLKAAEEAMAGALKAYNDARAEVRRVNLALHDLDRKG